MKLIICGNGFDLHHNIPTGYNNYKDYLEKHFPKFLKGFERFEFFAPIGSLWSDVEGALSIDYEELMDSVQTSYPDAMEDGDSKWGRMAIDVELITEPLNGFTGIKFAQWLNTIDIRDCLLDPNLHLSKEDLYLTFNYTDTLQKVYKIPEDHILHIHGKLTNINNCSEETVRAEIQFGSSEISAEKVEREIGKLYERQEFFGASTQVALDVLTEFVKTITKDLQKNYSKLKGFIKQKPISEIVIMGHSMAGTDVAYYKDIIVPKYRNKRWTFMHYDDPNRTDNLAQIESFIKEFKLDKTSIVDW